jgi:hypothetical protein
MGYATEDTITNMVKGMDQTIKSTYSDSKVLTDEYLYKIVNLPGIPEEA